MIYSNDYADLELRKKNYFIQTIIVPILCSFASVVIIYLLTGSEKLPTYFILFFIIGATIRTYYKSKWLKMPDGTFHYIQQLNEAVVELCKEPTEYEEIYYNSRNDSLFLIGFGSMFTIFGVIFLQKNDRNTSGAKMAFIVGVLLIFYGYRMFIDKSPKLKIAKNGIWTKNLGFKHWDEVTYAEVVVVDSDETPTYNLEIRLDKTLYQNNNQSGDRLHINGLTNYQEIESKINTSILEFNASKTQSTDAI